MAVRCAPRLLGLLPLLLAGCRAPVGDDGAGLDSGRGADSGDTAGDDGVPLSATRGDEVGDARLPLPGEAPRAPGADALPRGPVGTLLPDLRGLDLVIVQVDTLRADHLAAYGYARDTLPTTGGEPWRVVDGLVTGGPWTFPATATMLTAAWPDEHGFTDPGKLEVDELVLDLPTAAPTFGDAGWATALYSGNAWLTDLTDMAASFDHARHVEKTPGAYNLEDSAGRALAWLDTLPADQPALLVIQPMDLHLPYQLEAPELGAFGPADRPWSLDSTDGDVQRLQILAALAADPEGARQALVDTYDESLLGLDRGLRALLDGLDARGRLDHTVVVVTGDHGETLDDEEDGDFGHGQSVREELVRAPLLVRVPGAARDRRPCVASARDLFPTLLDALGLPAMTTGSGASLQHGCPGVAEVTWWSDERALARVAATDGHEKLERRCAEGTELGWDLDADPHERAPVAPEALTAYAGLSATVDATLARARARWPDVTCAGSADR